jgi:hypothetical protein
LPVSTLTRALGEESSWMGQVKDRQVPRPVARASSMVIIMASLFLDFARHARYVQS